MAIFLARQGKSKEEIKNYIETEFGYNFSRTLDEIRPTYEHVESCQKTVPEALTAFFESTDFEDAVRNGVSLGGDADTLTCIDGAIAEAFYGVPENLIEEGRKYLPTDILKVVEEFNEKVFGKKKNVTEFTRKFLSNKYLTKKFFADVRFIHVSASGAMGDAGVAEVWTKNFEHYRCYWPGVLNIDKFCKIFMKETDCPYFDLPAKDGWSSHYMGCGHNFYIKEELNDAYLQKFDEAQKNGACYMVDNDVPPIEEIMLELLNEPPEDDFFIEDFFGDMEDEFLQQTKNMESAINKFDLPDNIQIYRRAEISLLKDFEKILQAGGIFQDDGFTSCTTLKIGSTENEIEIVVLVPKGKGYGAYIAPMSAFPEECEFVLNRGTIFKVRSIDEVAPKNFRVVIELIGRSPKELF